MTVALLLPALRSAAPISNATPVTLPSIAPDGTAELTATSAEVCTVIPATEPAVTAPIVMPCIVITTALALGSDDVKVKMRDIDVVAAAVKVSPSTLHAVLEGVTPEAKNAVG